MLFWKSYICSNELDVQQKNAVSHSSTESEIVSLDIGLRLDGLPALELVFQIDRGNLRVMITNTTSLTIKSM